VKGVVKNRSHWSEIWIRFHSGDRNAFIEIYEEFIDLLFAYGSKITNDRELVKDCIQDLFYNLYRSVPDVHHPEYLEFYLFRSLRNEITHKIKKNKLRSSLTCEGMVQFNLKFQVEQNGFAGESDELRIKAVKQVLATLDPQKRELLFLKFNSGLNYAEIGRLLDINPDTVKKQVYRTLDHLRNKFGNQLMELLMIWIG
jgi:RNA polymerase sigma factor (sigma-70 family)